MGTDSAPHERSTKENCCGCAGCFTAHGAVELYAEVFESAGALDKLEAFCSFFGSDFYGLKRNTSVLTLEKKDWKVPDSYPFGADGEVVPLRAGDVITWSIVDDR